MKIKGNNSNFEPCPEFTGKAVCVGVTPLRKQQSQYGERNVFKVVFEVDAEKEDGSRYGVWSTNFTPTLNEKSSLRKFLRGWFRDTLPRAPLERLALLRIDGDLYESTRDALAALYPRLSAGGFVIVDDYGCIPGCRQAVDEYRQREGIATPLRAIDWTGVFWQKA